MNEARLKALQTKLKAAHKLQAQWAKAYNQAERALLRVGHDIDQLEKKIELARIQQTTTVHDGGTARSTTRRGARR
jgi:hypothetical protein